MFNPPLKRVMLQKKLRAEIPRTTRQLGTPPKQLMPSGLAHRLQRDRRNV
jgi:hypothetical protein